MYKIIIVKRYSIKKYLKEDQTLIFPISRLTSDFIISIGKSVKAVGAWLIQSNGSLNCEKGADRRQGNESRSRGTRCCHQAAPNPRPTRVHIEWSIYPHSIPLFVLHKFFLIVSSVFRAREFFKTGSWTGVPRYRRGRTDRFFVPDKLK